MDMVCCRTRTTRGNRDILTVMCLLTKFLIAVPMPNRTASDVAQAFLLNVLPFGVPKKLLSHRGNEWTTEAWTKVLALLEIKRAWTTPYYPQCNGAIERARKDLNAALGMWCKTHKQEWDEGLAMVCWSHNMTTHNDSGYSPFELVFDRPARLPQLIPTSLGTRDVDTWMQQRNGMVEDFKAALTETRRDRAQRFDEQVKLRTFEVKQRVLRAAMPSSLVKFAPKWTGPFVITERRGNLYKLRNPAGVLEPNWWNVIKLIALPDGPEEEEDNRLTTAIPKGAFVLFGVAGEAGEEKEMKVGRVEEQEGRVYTVQLYKRQQSAKRQQWRPLWVKPDGTVVPRQAAGEPGWAPEVCQVSEENIEAWAKGPEQLAGAEEEVPETPGPEVGAVEETGAELVEDEGEKEASLEGAGGAATEGGR